VAELMQLNGENVQWNQPKNEPFCVTLQWRCQNGVLEISKRQNQQNSPPATLTGCMHYPTLFSTFSLSS
jgi:hypothetical protein